MIQIIAEAGVNHNGSLALAKKMAYEAKQAGADIVKYQTFVPKLLVTNTAQKAGYQQETTLRTESQLTMLEKLALSQVDFIELQRYCKQIEIRFLSTPFDEESVDFLHQMGCDLWKIPSGEITSLPYLRQIAAFHQPVIMSTGMATLEEIQDALNVLRSGGAEQITLLHCTTAYPAPFEQINLRAMDTLAERFGLPVGYSDHSRGIAVSCAAAARGAAVLEKHFTLDCNMEGPDHKASLEPNELKRMVDSIREIELALGDGRKQPTALELENSKAARKSITAKRRISAGEAFSADNLTIKRPGTGISPMRWDEVLGTLATKAFDEDEQIWL